ncbi:DNA polymerase III subunit delta [Rosettibacter firmus]|uniref:DNA polymerase III subunit delta n=1 Tax=Rosettibacter firmus TaxID=3111522 RepID=UPI00336BB193
MAKKIIPSTNELLKNLKTEKFLPVYFICGEDDYTIEQTVNSIIKAAKPFIKSDFDIEVIESDRGQNFSQIIDIALAFPFGGGKKLIVVKNFERVSDKKTLQEYLKSPAEFTILVLINRSKINDYTKEPFSSLLQKGYLFETKSETGEELVDWLVNRAKEFNLEIAREDLIGLIEIVGEDKSLLESQLKKISDYNINKTVTFNEIKELISVTKKFSIFDLQEAIGRGDKSKAIEIGVNLLDNGEEIVAIINMLAKFILTIAQITEMVKTNVNDNEAANKLRVSWYYYINCKKANYLFSEKRLLNASRALLEADEAVKTTATDSKTILIMLITKMLS